MRTVSVVIPAYNAGHYICAAVESVLAQTYPNVECIVVDDGSTDDTADRLAKYGNRIVYVRQENRGRAAARNAGIQRATGSYIALLDADDYWAPEKLEKQVALFENHSSIGAVGCGARLVNQSGQFIRELRAAPAPLLPAGDKGFARLVCGEYGIAAPLSTLVLRRVCLDATGGFDDTINTMEEWDLLLRLIHCWDVACVMEPLAFYRAYGMHVPSKVSPRRRQDKLVEVVTRAFDRMDGPNRDSDLRNLALGKAYLRGALLDYATGNLADGARRLEKANLHAPRLFHGLSSVFVVDTAYFAVYLYDSITPLEESLAYTSTVFDHLPASLSLLAHMREVARDTVIKIHVFDGYERRDFDRVRTVAWYIAAVRPRLLLDRGLRSIVAESLVGTPLAKHIRKLVRAFGQGFLHGTTGP